MALTYLSTQTASSSSSLSFTSGIDSTYNEYQFHFVNMHPATNDVRFQFQVNATDGADFNDSLITSTYFHAYHNEADSGTGVVYRTANDLAQQALYQHLAVDVGSDNDQSVSGVLTLYAPSSTTYVKHFVSRVNIYHEADYSVDTFAAGYINDTTAIDEISFKFDSGNIDAGTIHMYGVG